MGEIGTIEKKGTNTFHKYNYIKEEDVTAKVRELLSKHNVFVFCAILDLKKEGPLTEVVCEYTFCCGDTGEIFKAPFRGHGHDNQDKGIYKAITGAHKYFLLKNFQLSAGDDPENESKDELRNEPVPQWQQEIPKFIDPKTFLVPFGRDKGTPVCNLSKESLEKSLDWCENKAKKPLGQSIVDFVLAIRAQLDIIEKSSLLNPDTKNYNSEDLPF